MTISSSNPASGSIVQPGDILSFVNDNTPGAVNTVVLTGTDFSDENIYAAGYKIGYTGTYELAGSDETFTFKREIGWPDGTFQIEVTYVGGAVTTLNYQVVPKNEYGPNMQPFMNSGTQGGAGAATFIELTDTPSSYASQGDRWIKVNSGETALEFVDAPSGSGDVSKSGASVADRIVTWVGTGNTIKDSGQTIADVVPTEISDLSDVDKTGWAQNQVLAFDAGGNLVPADAADPNAVVKSGTTADNRVARWDGLDTQTVQTSLVEITDAGVVSGVNTLNVGAGGIAVTGGGNISSDAGDISTLGDLFAGQVYTKDLATPTAVPTYGAWYSKSTESGRPFFRSGADVDYDLTTFEGLIDTPNAYAGQADRVVRVNATEDGLEFFNPLVAGAFKETAINLGDYNLTTTPPPGGGQVYVNSLTASAITDIRIFEFSQGEAFHQDIFEGVEAGDHIILSSASDNTSATYVVSTTTWNPSGGAGGGALELVVTLLAVRRGAAFTNNAAILPYILRRIQVGGASGGGDVLQTGGAVVDNRIVRWDGNATKNVQVSLAEIDDTGNITNVTSISASGYLDISESASQANPGAGVGRFYVKNVVPSRPYFIDDTGVEIDLTAGGATTFAALTDTNVGAQVNDQGLKWDGSDWVPGNRISVSPTASPPASPQYGDVWIET